jgi:hypothetical protein
MDKVNLLFLIVISTIVKHRIEGMVLHLDIFGELMGLL